MLPLEYQGTAIRTLDWIVILNTMKVYNWINLRMLVYSIIAMDTRNCVISMPYDITLIAAYHYEIIIPILEYYRISAYAYHLKTEVL